jgi:hypothetical protein
VIAQAELSEVREGKPQKTLDSEFTTFRAHLHASDLGRGTAGWLRIDFRLRRSGLVLAALAIGAMTSGIFWGGLASRWLGLTPTVDAAAILVVLPGIFAAYLARPEEHRLVKRLVSGLRVLIALLALASFSGAATLVVDLSEDRREAWWVLGAIVSSFLTALIALVWLSSKLRERDP